MRILLDFFCNDTATTEIYTLSLHDALPIYAAVAASLDRFTGQLSTTSAVVTEVLYFLSDVTRSEEHTSELQSLRQLVCRLLLVKKKVRDVVQKRMHRQDNVGVVLLEQVGAR